MLRECCKNSDWWQGKFRGCGYRMTGARTAIVEILHRYHGHLSIEDIYGYLQKDYPQIGLTTVYRTLDVLAGLGLVAKLDFGDGRARYELAQGPKGDNHHHHLICTSCNKVIDYTDFINEEVELLRQTEKGLNKKYNFKITSHVIQFSGLCEKCGVEK